MKTGKSILFTFFFIFLALPLWARYRPSDWESLPEVPNSPKQHVDLTQTVYRCTGPVEIDEETGGGIGALRVCNATVTIWMTSGAKITANGANAGNSAPGGAGIYLPQGTTLILRMAEDGSATVVAKGGNGYAASNGGNGGNGSSGGHGSGSNGGTGAYAGGSGIGGYGGKPGGGGSGSKGSSENTANAGSGAAGGAGAAAGDLWVFDGIRIDTGDKGGPGSPGQAGSGSSSGGGSWGVYGGGGGGGSGGGSGAGMSIGGGPGGGGGGGGGAGATCDGGGGGGGGAGSGVGGHGGGHGTGADSGGTGASGGLSTGGAGGAGGTSGTDAGCGGAGGSVGNGGQGGWVWYADRNNINAPNMTRTTDDCKGDGYPSQLWDAKVTLDANLPEPAVPRMQVAVTNSPDKITLATDGGTLCALPVEPPLIDGWTFNGYFTQPDGGTQVIAPDGQPVPGRGIGSAKTLYAQWDIIPVQPALAMATADTNTLSLAAMVTNAPVHQSTYGIWYYRQSGADDWRLYLENSLTTLGLGDVNEVSGAKVGDNPSGEYQFMFRVITVRNGNGLSETNDSNQVYLEYIRRIPPVYDAAAKTLWANGSSLLLRRDSRDPDCVVCYYDQEWDGVYEAALPRGMNLSAEGCWVDGGFQDGAQIGGGVKINFDSGEIYGLNAGTNIGEHVTVRQLTLGSDAHVGEGGKKGFWQVIK